MKYIDADKLIAEIERREKIHFNDYHIKENGNPADYGACNALCQLRSFISSLQQEQPECLSSMVDVDAVREDFMAEVYRVLDADPTNDRANAIISAFDSLPTVSQQPGADLEKEIEEHAIYMPHGEFAADNEIEEDMEWARKEFRHFYELGLNARKEE